MAIAIPAALLISLGLLGILNDSEDRMTVLKTDVVQFKIERSSYQIDPLQPVQNLYSDSEVSAEFQVLIGAQEDKHSMYGSDCIDMIVSATCNVSKGHVELLCLNYTDDSQTARVNFAEEHQLMKYENLSILEYRDWMKGNWKAFMTLSGENQPDSIYLWKPTHLVFYSPANQSHTFEATMTLTYWNQTTHKKLIMPIKVHFQPDSDSFDNSITIEPGIFVGYNSRYIVEDLEDFYKIWLERNNGVNLSIDYPDFYNANRTPKVSIYVYDPNLALTRSSIHRVNATGQLDFTSSSSGWFYIRIIRSDDVDDQDYVHYVYLLDISVSY